MDFFSEDTTELITGGYRGFSPTDRADEVVKLFEMAVKHEIPFHYGELYCDLLKVVYDRTFDVVKKSEEVQNDTK